MKVAEVKLTYKRKNLFEEVTIKDSKAAADVFRSAYPKGTIDHRELFFVMFLSNAHKVLGIMKLSEGGITGTVADVRIIMQAALLSNCTGIMLCHNHPSGNLQTSPADEDLTSSVEDACRLFKIKLLDHIILTSNGYFSFADQGML